jgi:hypothetical protein
MGPDGGSHELTATSDGDAELQRLGLKEEGKDFRSDRSQSKPPQQSHEDVPDDDGPHVTLLRLWHCYPTPRIKEADHDWGDTARCNEIEHTGQGLRGGIMVLKPHTKRLVRGARQPTRRRGIKGASTQHDIITLQDNGGRVCTRRDDEGTAPSRNVLARRRGDISARWALSGWE